MFLFIGFAFANDEIIDSKSKSNKKEQEELRDADASHCHDPVCLPDDFHWKPCSRKKLKNSSKGKKSKEGNEYDDLHLVETIAVCINDGISAEPRCVDPFYVPSPNEIVKCGACP